MVGGDYAGNDKIVSAYENGLLSIWRIGINQVTTAKVPMIPHDQITCISTNPHVSWMVALGTKKGSTIVMDLRSKFSRCLNGQPFQSECVISFQKVAQLFTN